MGEREFYALLWQWDNPEKRFFYMMYNNKNFVEYSSIEQAKESAERIMRANGGKEAKDPHFNYRVVKMCL